MSLEWIGKAAKKKKITAFLTISNQSGQVVPALGVLREQEQE